MTFVKNIICFTNRFFTKFFYPSWVLVSNPKTNHTPSYYHHGHQREKSVAALGLGRFSFLMVKNELTHMTVFWFLELYWFQKRGYRSRLWKYSDIFSGASNSPLPIFAKRLPNYLPIVTLKWIIFGSILPRDKSSASAEIQYQLMMKWQYRYHIKEHFVCSSTPGSDVIVLTSDKNNNVNQLYANKVSQVFCTKFVKLCILDFLLYCNYTLI